MNIDEAIKKIENVLFQEWLIDEDETEAWNLIVKELTRQK